MEAPPLPAFISKKPKSIHPRIHPSTDETVARFTFSDAQRWSRLGRGACGRKKGCKHAAVPLCSAGQVQIPEKREWHPDLVMVGFWLPGRRCNLCSQAGTRQEQRPGFAGQGPRRRLPLLLASPGTVSCENQLTHSSSSTPPARHKPLPVGVLCITEDGRTVGLWQRMGWDCLFVPGHPIPRLLRQGQYPVIALPISRGQRSHITVSAGQDGQIGARGDGVS